VLSDRVTNSFGKGVRSRGATYHRQGRVRLGDFDAEHEIRAVVQGAQAYTVAIEFECHRRSWVLYAGCSCPYACNHGELCKHIWATLLAIEASSDDVLQRFGSIPKKVRIELTGDDASLGFFDDDDDLIHAGEFDDDALSEEEWELRQAGLSSYEEAHTFTATRGRRGSRTRKRAKPERLPAWQALLRDIPTERKWDSASNFAKKSPIDPIYILDLEDCRYATGPVVSLAQQQRTASGKLGKAKRLSISPMDIPRIREVTDRKICMLLLGAGGSSRQYGRYGDYGDSIAMPFSQWTIPPALQAELFPMMSATGRFLMRATQRDDPIRLTWDDGDAWELALAIRPADRAGAYELHGHLRRGEGRLALGEVDCCIPGSPALVVRDGVLSRCEAHGCFAWLDALRGRPPAALQRGDRPKLMQELSRLRLFPPVEWPPDWGVRDVDDLHPHPQLSLEFDNARSSWSRDAAFAEIVFHYGDARVSAGAPGATLVDAAGGRLIRRKLEAERGLIGRCMELGARVDGYDPTLSVRKRKIPELVSTLLAENWTVLGNRKPYRAPGEFNIRVCSGIDWFDVHGAVAFDGESAGLPELLAAYDQGERFVKLGDGSLGMLPEDWLRRNRDWLDLGRPEDGHIRFANTQIGLIDAMLTEMPEAHFDRNLAAARRKLARFTGVPPRKAPRGFRGTLRTYQEEGLGWLHFLDTFDWGGCLADDMGLGKTVQVLALLADRRRQGKHGPTLVVAPKSVVFNWAREAERFAPNLRVLNYTGLERKKSRDDFDASDIILTTYGTMRRDIAFLRERKFNYVVLDEAQAIKNPKSLSAKAARLLPARRRVVLTGTPVENELGDLWSLFEFLNPGMLGTIKAFKRFTGANHNGDGEAAGLPVLRRMLRPFILRRTKEQAAPDLPERSEQTIYCELTKRQAEQYRALRDHYRRSLLARVDDVGLARSKMHVLEALLRLRQAACHPGLIDAGQCDVEAAKLETLVAMVAEITQEGHKALVFSQFTKLLAIVRAALDARGITYEYLDGRTRRRAPRIDRFQTDPACALFLISLKAGGTGLNLTAADYVFILDPWWNPAVEAQAIDRAHRIGRRKKVIAYRLIARDTIESKILELQQSKRDLADAIITRQNSIIRTLTREDLTVLLA
jgi:superfamily II DNA or RNA helicase